MFACYWVNISPKTSVLYKDLCASKSEGKVEYNVVTLTNQKINSCVAITQFLIFKLLCCIYF